jgi:hypothetical protein
MEEVTIRCRAGQLIETAKHAGQIGPAAESFVRCAPIEPQNPTASSSDTYEISAD